MTAFSSDHRFHPPKPQFTSDPGLIDKDPHMPIIPPRRLDNLRKVSGDAEYLRAMYIQEKEKGLAAHKILQTHIGECCITHSPQAVRRRTTNPPNPENQAGISAFGASYCSRLRAPVSDFPLAPRIVDWPVHRQIGCPAVPNGLSEDIEACFHQ